MRVKTCHCGRDMMIVLEEVRYGSDVRIVNVPIYHCADCDYNEVITDVKEDMKTLLKSLEEQPDRKVIWFNETCELARLLDELQQKNVTFDSIGGLIQDRINELLDLYILADSLNDEQWKQEISKKLTEVIHTQ